MTASQSPEPEPEQHLLPVDWLDLVMETGDPVGGDAAQCEALARARGHVRALESLQPLEAPTSLDGLVVASLHAGARQERAVEFMTSLPALAAPQELDRLLADMIMEGPVRPAPNVLDRLVEERVADPEKAMARSMAQRLESQMAPAALEERVREQLIAELEPSGIGSRSRVLAAVGAVALAVVLLVSTQSWMRSQASGTEQGPQLDAPRVALSIERVDARDLDPVERAFLGAMGGAL